MTLAYAGFQIYYSATSSATKICVYGPGVPVYTYIYNPNPAYASTNYYSTNSGTLTYYTDTTFDPISKLPGYGTDDCSRCSAYYYGYPCYRSYIVTNSECGTWTATVTNLSTSTLFYRNDAFGGPGTAYLCGILSSPQFFQGDNYATGCGYPPFGGTFIEIEEYTGQYQYCDYTCDGWTSDGFGNCNYSP